MAVSRFEATVLIFITYSLKKAVTFVTSFDEI